MCLHPQPGSHPGQLLLPRLQAAKTGRARRSGDPLGKLHPTGTPGQKPGEKRNLTHMKRSVLKNIFFLPSPSSFSESQPVKLGSCSGWRRVTLGLHAAVGTPAYPKHLSLGEMSIALARLFFLCSKEQANLLICG